MLTIGCHLSKSKGYYHMGQEALSIDANTFQFFSRNPRGGKSKKIDLHDINKFLTLKNKNNIPLILAHSPYTMNACSKKVEIRELANSMISEDLETMEYLPNNLYNFHPGSHTGQGKETGIKQISNMLNNCIKENQTTTILLETMAGKGTEIGSKFEELNDIINQVELNEYLGVCLDTCHVYDGGYDIKNNLDNVIDEFDDIIGLNRLYAIHLNDSVHGLNSHKDRHACIGDGKLGLDAISNIINHPKLKKLPFFLETPNDIDGYKKEIRILKNHYNNK